MTLNDFLNKFLRITLWIWLPFYVLPDLWRDAREKLSTMRRKR